MEHLYPYVLPCCDVRCAFWLNHNSADVINEDGRPLNHMTRLQCVQQVCWRLLSTANLQPQVSVISVLSVILQCRTRYVTWCVTVRPPFTDRDRLWSGVWHT